MELHSGNTKQSVYFIFDIQTDAPFDLHSLIYMGEFYPSRLSVSGFHFHLNSIILIPSSDWNSERKNTAIKAANG